MGRDLLEWRCRGRESFFPTKIFFGLWGGWVPSEATPPHLAQQMTDHETMRRTACCMNLNAVNCRCTMGSTAATQQQPFTSHVFFRFHSPSINALFCTRGTKEGQTCSNTTSAHSKNPMCLNPMC